MMFQRIAFLVFAIILMTAQNGIAQEKPNIKIHQWNTTQIENTVLDPMHLFYFDALHKKFENDPNSLSKKEAFFFYFGYPFTGYYNPILQLEYETKIIYANDSLKYTEAKILGDSLFKKYPISILGYEELMFASSKLGDTIKASYFKKRYERLLEVLVSSGDGKSRETAYVVTSLKDIYVITQTEQMLLLNRKEKEYDNQTFVLAKVYLNGKKQKIWFNTSLITYYGPNVD